MSASGAFTCLTIVSNNGVMSSLGWSASFEAQPLSADA